MERSVSGPVTCPTGAARFCERRALTTWSTPTPAAVRRVGSSTTLSVAESAPATFTWATPATARSSPPICWSAIWVSCVGVSVVDVSASETMGSASGSKRWMSGSMISVGSCARTAEMASRTSCVAWSTGLSKLNWTMICANPSVDVERTSSSPLMLATRSSMRSTTSRSTWSGEAPGYATATKTIGASMSGNSSVCSRRSAASPNATSAIIVTTVMIGRLMAKSEMNMAPPKTRGPCQALPGAATWSQRSLWSRPPQRQRTAANTFV